MNQMFGFSAGQNLKLSTNTCFPEVFFGGELRRRKTWKVGPLKNVNFNLISFKRRSFDNNFSPISLGDMSKVLVPEMVFQQIVVKVTIGFSS